MKYDSLPIEQLQTWATFNGVRFQMASITGRTFTAAGVDKGAGILATAGAPDEGSDNDILFTVPSDLILSKERVFSCAKSDRHLREVLEALGDFVDSPRKAILIFLLLQITHNSPDIHGETIGLTGPLSDYVRFLPKSIPLPIFYSEADRELLRGTSLKEAVEQKLRSLESEFTQLRDATKSIGWCQRHWFDDETGCFGLDDWKLLDAIYRSRALDLPGIGHAMVPIVDMANHVSDNKRNARFEVMADGSVMLTRAEGVSIEKGEEINITYGPGGACEMLFSYGFLEDSAASARELFLSMDIPTDDPLRMAKKAAAQEAPGVRLFMDKEGEIGWESNLVWWASVNEEDGLDFQIVQDNSGGNELRTLWKGQDLLPSNLRECLALDDCSEIFRLRATVLVQDRVEMQGAELVSSERELEQASQQTSEGIRTVLNTLRTLELDLLTGAYAALEKQKAALLSSPAVHRYLESV